MHQKLLPFNFPCFVLHKDCCWVGFWCKQIGLPNTHIVLNIIAPATSKPYGTADWLHCNLNTLLSFSRTVMNDIITTMFNKKFLEELFKPQELYSKKALRTVFDRLAHASIMRLNQASMDKVSHHACTQSSYVFTAFFIIIFITIPLFIMTNQINGKQNFFLCSQASKSMLYSH